VSVYPTRRPVSCTSTEGGLSRRLHHATICRLDLGKTPANTLSVKFRALLSSLILAVVSIGMAGARPQQPAAPSKPPEPPAQLTPSEMEIYKRAQTLIDWTPREIHECPFLHGLRPARNQDRLPALLKRAGETGTLLFHDFPRVACDEEVVAEVFTHALPGMSHMKELHKFRYIIVPQLEGDAPAFEEYRTDLKGNPLAAQSPSDLFMITSRFTSTWLYLSPADQPDSRFRYFGSQTIRKRRCQVVGFAQEPERARRIAEFLVGDRSAAVLLQGLAWIDSDTSEILRITTWLLAPRTDINLSSNTSTVDFYPVQPNGFDRVLWLPRDVVVTIDYRGARFRNTHHYSNFKLFRVESTIQPAE
jgi:hypothetical protein